MNSTTIPPIAIESVVFEAGSVSITFVRDSEPIVAALTSLEQKIDLLATKEDQIIATQGEIMANIHDVEDAVAADTSVVASAVTLLGGLAQMLTDALAAGGSPAQIQAVIDHVNANKDALAAAVAANTPAAPPPPAPPPGP